MSIQARCPSCGLLVNAPDGSEGKHGKCPKCGTKFMIGAGGAAQAAPQPPSPASGPTLEVICPSCNTCLQVPAQLAGQVVKCSRCRQDFMVESQPPAGPPEAQLPPLAQVEPQTSVFYQPATCAPYPPSSPYAGTGDLAQRHPIFVQTSGMAIWSMVLGILSLLCCSPMALPSLILGIVALGAIKQSRGYLKGRGMAIAGIVMSCITLFAIIIFILAAVANPELIKKYFPRLGG